MTKRSQCDLKRAFNIRYAAGHVQHLAVAGSAGHGQTVRLCKIDDRLIFRFRSLDPKRAANSGGVMNLWKLALPGS